MFDEAMDVTEQEVVQPAEEIANDTITTDDNAEETVENSESAEQTAEENAHFADLRRKQELDAARTALVKEKEAREREQEIKQRLSTALEKFGYHGSAEEIADMAQADNMGIPVEQIRQERENEEARIAEIKSRDDALAQKEHEIEEYKRREAERAFSSDLSEIQKMDPKIKKLEDLGKDFISLRAAGVSNVTAYNAIKESLKPQAKSTGAVGSTAPDKKEYYTREEVAAMSQSEVDENYETIRKSQTTWR